MSNDPKKPTPPVAAKPPEAPKVPPPLLSKIKKINVAVLNFFRSIAQSKSVTSVAESIFSLGGWGWLKIFTCFALAFLTYGVYKTAPHWKKLWDLPYLSTFENVADSKHPLADGTPVITYSNDLLAPQYVVLINKIVVNVLPGKMSTKNPMIAFDLYIRTDAEETSVEIKDREKQLQDHLQRFCEGLNYDQILSEDGKMIWKQKMKREINLVLNSGRVKDVFFKTLLIKP